VDLHRDQDIVDEVVDVNPELLMESGERRDERSTQPPIASTQAAGQGPLPEAHAYEASALATGAVNTGPSQIEDEADALNGTRKFGLDFNNVRKQQEEQIRNDGGRNDGLQAHASGNHSIDREDQEKAQLEKLKLASNRRSSVSKVE